MRDLFLLHSASRDADPITVSHQCRARPPSETDPPETERSNHSFPCTTFWRIPLVRLAYDAEYGPSTPSAALRGQDDGSGNGGDPRLCDLPAIVVDRDADVVALPRRKRNMAGRPSICPATLGNVNCLGRLVQPGGAAIYPHLSLLRNSNEPIRWTSMRASVSSSGRSFSWNVVDEDFLTVRQLADDTERSSCTGVVVELDVAGTERSIVEGDPPHLVRVGQGRQDTVGVSSPACLAGDVTRRFSPDGDVANGSRYQPPRRVAQAELPDDGASNRSALRRYLQKCWRGRPGVISRCGEAASSPTRLAVARPGPVLWWIPSHLSSSPSGFFCADCKQTLRRYARPSLKLPTAPSILPPRHARSR